MERLLGKKKITTLLFLAFLFGYAILNAGKELPILKETIENWYAGGGTVTELLSQVNTAIDENVVEKEQESAYFEAFKKSVGCLAGSRNRILFHLDTYKGTLYKEVITVDKDYFMEQIYPQIFEI